MPVRDSGKTRADWIAAAIEVIDTEGVASVRVEPLAARLGVTKGSFYWHFANRDALLDALLQTWEASGTFDIIAEVDRAGGDPADRLRLLWKLAHRGGRLGAEHAIRDWARSTPEVETVVKRVDERRLEYLRAIFRDLGCTGDDVEARALLTYSLLIGDHFIKGRTTKAVRRRALDCALSLLLRP